MNYVEQHYKENRFKYLKRLSFRAGTEWDAEDVLQDAYERAIKYYSAFDNSQDFGAWFNTILENALRAHKNAAKGQFISLDEIDEESIPCAHYSTELLKEIYQRIKSKNPTQQEVLTLHFKHEYGALQISQITDCRYSNCRKIIHQFRKELKEKYED